MFPVQHDTPLWKMISALVQSQVDFSVVFQQDPSPGQYIVTVFDGDDIHLGKDGKYADMYYNWRGDNL